MQKNEGLSQSHLAVKRSIQTHVCQPIEQLITSRIDLFQGSRYFPLFLRKKLEKVIRIILNQLYLKTDSHHSNHDTRRKAAAAGCSSIHIGGKPNVGLLVS